MERWKKTRPLRWGRRRCSAAGAASDTGSSVLVIPPWWYREKRKRTRAGCGPHSKIQETDADRTWTGLGRCRFSQDRKVKLL
eukprot:gene23437-biopygen4331